MLNRATVILAGVVALVGLTAPVHVDCYVLPDVARASKHFKYPFDELVAFGDEFSDNGNGSVAHGFTQNPDKFIYGYNTWTNGPVAVMYLSELLNVPLQDFAFGGCCGGGKFGATLNNTYSPSAAGSPDVPTQIANYSDSFSCNVDNSLQFIWVGQNDVMLHTDAFWLGDPHNAQFYANYSSRTVSAVQSLLDLGAPYVMVANIYPKHLAPATPQFLCSDPSTRATCVSTWGQVISNANSALATALKPFGNKVIYYDVFSFMTALLSQPLRFGFTRPLTSTCDDQGSANFESCIYNGAGRQFFWTNYIQPTTAVHRLIAQDMYNTINRHFA